MVMEKKRTRMGTVKYAERDSKGNFKNMLENIEFWVDNNNFIINLGKKSVKIFHLLTQNWQPCEHGKNQILVMGRLPDTKEWNTDMDEIQLQKAKVIHAGTNNKNFFYNPGASLLETIKKEK